LSYKTGEVVTVVDNIIVVGGFGKYLVVNVGVLQGRDSKRQGSSVVEGRQGFCRF